MFLRQQLIVLERQVLRSQMTGSSGTGDSDQGLARRFDRRETGYTDRVAPVGLQVVLATKITRVLSDVWVAQQARQATPYAEGPRVLIRDNDKKYGRYFT